MPSTRRPLTRPRAAARHDRRTRHRWGRLAALAMVTGLAASACEPAPDVQVPPTSTPTTVAPAPTFSSATAVAATATTGGWNWKVIADPTSRTGSVIFFDWNGPATMNLEAAADANLLSIVLRGDQCDGAPAYTVSVDGVDVANGTIASTTWTTVNIPVSLLAGTHRIGVSFTNDHWLVYPVGCDRKLYVDTVTLSGNGTRPISNVVTPPATGFVHQSGTRLLDGANRPLKLRGVNLGSWLLWEAWVWSRGSDFVGESEMMANLNSLVGTDRAERFRADVRNNFVSAADFQAMATYGINVARVPFNYRLLEDDARPFTYKDSGWAVLDRMVQQAKQAGVYLVFDMHAAPCGQSLSWTADFSGSSYMWLSGQCMDRMVSMWKAIAGRYQNQNIVAGYDLLNESVAGDSQLYDLYKRTTAAIREVDKNHVVIYEGNNVARDFAFMTAPIDSNSMLSVHDYPWMFTSDVSTRTAAYRADATRLGAPMWIGEYGQSVHDDIAKQLRAFDAEPTIGGAAMWTWKQVPAAATFQGIKHTTASQRLVDWIADTTRTKPSPAEAEQGMVDFITAITFAKTVPDAKLVTILRGG